MSRLAVLRLKVLVSRYGPSLVIGLSLLGAVLVGVAGMEYANPPTTEVTDETNRQTIHSELHTSANTTGNTTLYEPGTELVDQPVYLLSATPRIELAQQTAVPEGQSVRVEQDITVRYRVTRNGATFWEESNVLVRNETTTSAGNVTSTVSLNASDVRTRRDEITAEVGDAGTVQTHLVVSLSYETDQYTGALTETVPMTMTDNWYSIGEASLERTHSTSVSRRVSIPTQNPYAYWIPGGAGALLLLAAGSIAIAHLRGIDRRGLEQRVQELRYAEWVSTGTIPDSIGEPTIAVDSLEGLVDVAIDTDGRVIHDESRDAYIVIDGSVVYYYSPDGALFDAAN